MDLAELDALFAKAGLPKMTDHPRVWFEGASMVMLGDRDERQVKTFESVDAMCRSLLASGLVHADPRRGAALYPSAITPVDGPALWQVTCPEHSMLRARGNGLLAVLDTSGLFADPKHGAAQITILDAATGAIRATWLPPHGLAWAWFDGDSLVIDDLKQKATVCDPLTGQVIDQIDTGSRPYWTEPLLPNVLHCDRVMSRLETPDGTVLWERAGWIRSTARSHGLSIIKSDDSSATEAIRDDGTTAWTAEGALATVTDETVWLDDGEILRIVDAETGRERSTSPAPWGSFKMYGSHNGWDASDGLVLVSDDRWIAAYDIRAT